MNTDRFNLLRKKTLSRVFGSSTIAKTWRDIVKNQLRSDVIDDLFDYYDYNYSIDEISKVLSKEILLGRYYTKEPIIYKVEKKNGVCRHIVHPSPSDALILQCLINTIGTSLLKRAPTTNAFFSRDHAQHKLPHQVELDRSFLPWREQWKLFQKQIYSFNDEKKYVVATDLANYFDSISITDLKGYITSLVKIDEVVTDLLFNSISNLAWIPDYMPQKNRGLPVINIESVRILAHSYLYELDFVVNKKTKGCYVRWMDDIDFGVDSINEANYILNSMSDILQSRGLSLNQAKTKIYDYKQGEKEFCISENRYLDLLLQKVKEKKITTNDRREARKFFRSILLKANLKSWDKIVKRTFTYFGQIKDRYPLGKLVSLYSEYPTYRSTIFYYLSNIGYSTKAALVLLEILKNTNSYDDVAYLFLVKCLVNWKIPISIKTREYLRHFDNVLLKKVKHFNSEFDFYCLLMFRSKYMKGKSLAEFIEKYESYWNKFPFLRRQVMSIISRLLPISYDKMQAIINREMLTGYSDTSGLIGLIFQFSKLITIPSRLMMYLFPVKKKSGYEINRFFVLCAVLRSDNIQGKEIIYNKINQYIDDKYYIRIIKDICPDFVSLN